ncbi:MAG: HyaD/HybD family hydrogenase maturation endopeptidase [Desulfobacterota bacterium]|nr:HyaD/HybD family hydrogenase maturation endopeptidase [Thermodesulfobacteriota bacterium]
MAPVSPITVLGLGNILLGDEGFGVHFVRWFSARHRFPDSVRVLDGGTLGYGLLDTVCRCSHLIVVDVIKADDVPGAVYRFTGSDMARQFPSAGSAHEIAFADVLRMAELLGQAPEVVFLCVVPACCDWMCQELTPQVQARFADIEQLLLAELAALGVTPESGAGYA